MVIILVLINTAVFSLAAIVGTGGLGRWLGQRDPVSSPLVVTAILPDGEGSRINGYFDVLRPDECKWRRFDWRLGKRGSRDVPLEIETAPAQRSGGLNYALGWHLNVPP